MLHKDKRGLRRVALFERARDRRLVTAGEIPTRKKYFDHGSQNNGGPPAFASERYGALSILTMLPIRSWRKVHRSPWWLPTWVGWAMSSTAAILYVALD